MTGSDLMITARFEDAVVRIRQVGRRELEQIRERATRHCLEEGRLESAFDACLADVLLGRAAVRGWRGFTRNGKPLLYSRRNRDLLMRRFAGFARFVNDTVLRLLALEDARRALVMEGLRAHLRARADYPGVSCAACREMREVDGHSPPCLSEGGCPVPPIPPEGARALAIRSAILRLRGLAGAGAVLKAYGAGEGELELLAAIEEELRENRKLKEEENEAGKWLK